MQAEHRSNHNWKTKPTDRFVLRWIKCHLSARITPHLIQCKWLRPWMVTLCSSGLGLASGVVFALGLGWLAGALAAAAQILDGVDGQYARMTNRASAGGALLDSVMDRYSDGAMMIGLVVYLIRTVHTLSTWFLLVVGFLALSGSSMISYSSARAQTLRISSMKITLVSKGTRTSVVAICALGSALWAPLPMLALIYLAIHPNMVVAGRLARAFEASSSTSAEADD